MTDLRSRVVSGLKWQAAAKVGSQVISWSVTIYVMRLLAPADYGLMAMTMVLVGLTALVAEMGFGAALVRAPVADLPLQRSVFGLALITNLALYALLVAAAPLAVWHFSEPRLALLTLVLGLQLPLATLSVVPEAMARRELRFKPLSIIELAVQVTTVLATLSAALAGLGVWALVVGQVTQTVVRSGLMAGVFGMVRPSFVLRGQRGLMAFGGSLTVNRTVWYFALQADIFIVGKLLGAQLLGTYSVALNLANMPMQKIMSVANQVAYSAFAKLQQDPVAMRAGLLNSTRLMLALAVGALWCIAAVAPDLIPLLLGDKWAGAIVPFQIMAAVVPVRIICGLLSTALIAAGFVNDDLKNTLTGACILIPSFFVGAVNAGIIGVAWAWAIGYPVFAMFLLRRVSLRLGTRSPDILRQLLTPVTAGLAMWASVIAAKVPLAATPLPIRLGLLIFLALLTYSAVIVVIDRSLRGELLALLALTRMMLVRLLRRGRVAP